MNKQEFAATVLLNGYRHLGEFDSLQNLRSLHQRRVNGFMALADQALPAVPEIPPLDVRRLRAELILEEALETINALGFSLGSSSGLVEWNKEPDLIKIVDGCCDLRVVTTGTLSACGVSDEAVQHAVDCNNLEKFLPGSYKNESGKWIKPPNHKPPPIEEILIKQGWKK